MDKYKDFRDANNAEDTVVPKSIVIDNFEQCKEMPDLKKFLFSENLGGLLECLAKKTKIFKGDLFVSHSRVPFFVMKSDDNEVAVAIDRKLFFVSKEQDKDLTYQCFSDIDYDNKGFRSVENLSLDTKEKIKGIEHIKYQSSKNNPYEDDGQEAYESEKYTWSRLVLLRKSEIPNNILNKLYSNSLNILKQMPSYFICKYLTNGYYGSTDDIMIIESYINGGEFPDRIYVKSKEVDGEVYWAIGEGWYLGKGSKRIRIETIMKELRNKKFGFGDFFVNCIRKDFEQGIGIPDEIMEIVEMYEKTIAEQQVDPR